MKFSKTGWIEDESKTFSQMKCKYKIAEIFFF